MLTSITLERVHAPEIAISTVADTEQWDALLSYVPQAHFPQSSCYGEGKRTEGWSVQRFVFSADGQPVALSQVLVKRFAGFPVARINRGPMFFARDPEVETRDAVLRALRRHYRFLRHGILLIAPSLPGGEESASALRAAGFRQRGTFAWGSSFIDLTRPLDDIHAALHTDWRTKLRKAQKSGVGLRLRTDRDAVEWLLDKHVENMRDKEFDGPSPAFVRGVVAAAPKKFTVLQAMVNGEPAAALLVMRFGQQAENFIGWFGEAGKRVSAGNFLMWNSVVEMKRAGCRTLDLGGFSTSERYGRFKRGMRGAEYKLSGEWLAF
jgi:lipid II:glycine glycyltransferase (peptidoglycan interpeptide bridge formation enzyme)